MLVSIISLIISCLIQGILSNYLGYTYSELSFFSTIYILINLLVLKPYFENEKKYLIVLLIFAFAMGITYTDAVLLNVFLIFIIYYFSKVFHFYFPYNFFTLNISCLLGIFIYHFITFLFLFLLKSDYYTLSMLIKIITHSVPMTIIYTSFLYFELRFIFKGLDIKEIK